MKSENYVSKKNPWNSLEVAKLLVASTIPISLAIFGYYTSQALKERQYIVDKTNRLIDKRQILYDEIRIPINDIFVYIEDLGHYKDLNPVIITLHRRNLHRLMHTNRAYWSNETFSEYLKYMDEVAFSTFEGENIDAKIRDDPSMKQKNGDWLPDWTKRHTGTQHPDHKNTYNRMMDMFAKDIGANPNT